MLKNDQIMAFGVLLIEVITFLLMAMNLAATLA